MDLHDDMRGPPSGWRPSGDRGVGLGTLRLHLWRVQAFWAISAGSCPPAPRPTAHIPADALGDAEALSKQYDLPGVDRSTIELTTQQGTLPLSAERPAPDPGRRPDLLTERPTGGFSRGRPARSSSQSLLRARRAGGCGPGGGRRLQQGPTVDLHHPSSLRLPPRGQRRVEEGPDGAGFVQVQGRTAGMSHVSRAQRSPARDVPARALGEDDAQGSTRAGRLRVQRQGLAA